MAYSWRIPSWHIPRLRQACNAQCTPNYMRTVPPRSRSRHGIVKTLQRSIKLTQRKTIIVRRQSNNWRMLHIKFCMCFWRWVMGAQVKSFTFIAKIFISSDLHKRCLAVSSWISCPRHLTWKLLPRNPLLNSQMTALTACNHSLLTQARNLHCNLHGSRCCEARCHMVLQKALLVQKDSWQMLIGGQVIQLDDMH